MLSKLFRKKPELELWDEAAEGLLGVVKERIEAGARDLHLVTDGAWKRSVRAGDDPRVGQGDAGPDDPVAGDRQREVIGHDHRTRRGQTADRADGVRRSLKDRISGNAARAGQHSGDQGARRSLRNVESAANSRSWEGSQTSRTAAC